MKRKLITILLTISALISLSGCSLTDLIKPKEIIDPFSLTPDDFEPMYYLSEEELPEDNYYIVREYTNLDTYDLKGNLVVDEAGSVIKHNETRYYPLYKAEANYKEIRTEAMGFDANRILWVNYNQDEGLIPTMYATDKLIYKSSSYIPTKYALEKFFDDGYTLGVSGLYQDLSGNYRYVSAENDGNGHTMSKSDAIGFDALTADSIYLVSVGDERITPLNMSLSGTVTGLELMGIYPCDIRVGTEKVSADLRCNIHYFSSAETYMFGSFTFITDVIAKMNIPSYVTTGYYTIGSGGMFRYIADPGINDYHTIAQASYNDTIYTYNEDGYVNGTTIGLEFDDNDFLVADNGYSEDPDAVKRTYDEVLIDKETEKNETVTVEETVAGATKKTPSKSGNYIGSYRFDVVSEPETTGSGYMYTITATCIEDDNDEVLVFKYEQTAVKDAPEEGKSYKVVFKEKSEEYNVIKITPLDTEDEAENSETEDIEENDDTVNEENETLEDETIGDEVTE